MVTRVKGVGLKSGLLTSVPRPYSPFTQESRRSSGHDCSGQVVTTSYRRVTEVGIPDFSPTPLFPLHTGTRGGGVPSGRPVVIGTLMVNSTSKNPVST